MLKKITITLDPPKDLVPEIKDYDDEQNFEERNLAATKLTAWGLSVLDLIKLFIVFTEQNINIERAWCTNEDLPQFVISFRIGEKYINKRALARLGTFLADNYADRVDITIDK